MMGQTSHLFCVYAAFSSYCASFSLMTSLTMMVLGPGHLVCALFNFLLKIMLVVSVAQNPLVVSVDYFPLVASVEHFQLIESENTFFVSVEYFHLVESVEYFQLVESQNYFQFVEFQNYGKT